MTQKVSTEVQTESTRIASGIKKPGQSREQTKLIAAGIEKGIAEYKKQHKAKARQLDKQKKQKIRSNTATAAKENEAEIEIEQTQVRSSRLPWALLALSWAGFAGYLVQNGVIKLG
ncbi:hypothetical protein PE36_10648 [Moritella sp. PE36]|uniref:DUF2956 domain-containing protein n=1 Tax=Moritella sp. PE36 TaxID=58051 RepID=UPI0001569D93|nr:DUF2956 domain-containing protein [Moritella sp. PE36]EDM66046.1 hypothetical protein PE36_10648 [Moritella sp. PE36]